jgi:predicted phosphate transport protein (TIGR00153 family)
VRLVRQFQGDIPLSNLLENLFGSSPVMPLEQHVNIAYRCTKELVVFFEAVMEEDWDKATEIRRTIAALEHEADNLKKEIRLHLPKSLFMPVPREDLLELLLVQDKMANLTKDVSGLVLGRRMVIPDVLRSDFLIFVQRNIDAAKQARKSVRELDELFTSGFRGAEVSLVTSLIETLDNIETETDDLQASLRRKLFKIEESLKPVDVIFLYRVIELTGEIANMAERVGRRLELLLSH